MEIITIPRTAVTDERLWLFLQSLSEDVTFAPDQVLDAVCKFFGVREIQVAGKRRFGKIVKAREYYAFLAYEVFGSESLKDIGERINKHHSTIIHYNKSLKNRYQYDLSFRNEFHYFMKTFYPEFENEVKERFFDGTQ